MLIGIGRKAQQFWRAAKRRKGKETEPVDDIQRENLDQVQSSSEEETLLGPENLLPDIKKNWVQNA